MTSSMLCNSEVLEELNLKIQALEEQMNQLRPQPKEKKIEDSCTCEICGKLLKNKYTLKTHLKLHQDKTLIKIECPTCHKLYCSKYYLTRHIKEKHTPSQIEESISDIKEDINQLINDKTDDSSCLKETEVDDE